MSSILIVDDSSIELKVAASLIEDLSAGIATAGNGAEALDKIAASQPDIVITDMKMPVMDGFELVREVRQKYPNLPVIIMTAYGNEALSVKALQLGAASFVHKDRMADELLETVRSILSISIPLEPDPFRLVSLVDSRSFFELDSTLRDLDLVISYLQDDFRRLGVCDEADMVRVSTAVHEAIVNATEHGNLEVSSGIREEDSARFREIVNMRTYQLPYCNRRVRVSANLTRDHVRIVVADEGQGFDPESLPDPTDPENIGKVSGRGVFLMRTFMDEVVFNKKGNEVTMIKRRKVSLHPDEECAPLES